MKAVNLLPSDSNKSPKAKPASADKPAASGGGMGAFAVLGALVFAVFATAAMVMAGNTVKDRTAELARVQADVTVVQSQLAALKPYADFQTIAAQRVATVTQLAQGRFDWEQALRDLSRALPKEVRLKSLRGTVSAAVGGGGGSGLRGSRQAPAVELSGCARNQATVARLMSRLKVVRGVTRVSLSKSERAAPTLGGAGEILQAGNANDPNLLCGKNRPPAFEVVVFFERSQALAGTGTPGAPPTVAPGAAAPGQAQGGAGAPAQPATGNSSTQAPTTTGVSAP